MQKRKTYYVMAAVGLLLLGGMMSFGPERVMAALGYTPIRDVDNRGRNPFQKGVSMFVSDGVDRDNVTFTVPANKRLVIEYVSGFLSVPPGAKAHFAVQATSDGQTAAALVPGTLATTTASFDDYRASAPILLYADAGTTVTLSAFRRHPTSGLAGDAVGFMSVTGHLVNLP